MQIRRDQEFGDDYYIGAVRRVYGKKADGTFICPLDICFYHVEPSNNEEVETGAGEGAFLDYSVSSPGGGYYGKISDYSLPASSGTLTDVNPIVEVTPTKTVKRRFDSMPDITKDTIVIPKKDDEVLLQYFNTISKTWQTVNNKGTVTKLQQKFPYLNSSSYRIDAFKVVFDKDVYPNDIGTRVIPINGEGVIGMLITVKDLLQPRGAECLVYPASKIKWF